MSSKRRKSYCTPKEVVSDFQIPRPYFRYDMVSSRSSQPILGMLSVGNPTFIGRRKAAKTLCCVIQFSRIRSRAEAEIFHSCRALNSIVPLLSNNDRLVLWRKTSVFFLLKDRYIIGVLTRTCHVDGE